MNTIQLSIDELIFAFYSEGMFEQGISLKEIYFPEMNDSDLKVILECATRSLLAKELVEESNSIYKLKKPFKEFMYVMNNAESTVKASRFDMNREGESTFSFHKKNDLYYLHRVKYDQQVHQITEIGKVELIEEICTFFNGNEKIDSGFNINIQIEHFEEILNGLQQNPTDIIKQSLENENEYYVDFIKDLSSRNSKMDSIMYMEYDKENLPELLDICFIIPGSKRTWIVSRESDKNYIIEEWNLKRIKSSLFKDHAITF